MLCDEKGFYPTELDTWEERVLEAEMKQEGFKFWYRNPDRPSQDSLGITYINGDETKVVRPDFIFFAEIDKTIVVDIIDPHEFHLADALPKLQGLARYAETHSQFYRRILAVAEFGGNLRMLNLNDPAVCQAILVATNAESLYKIQVAGSYK